MAETAIVAVIEDPFVGKLLNSILTRYGYAVRETTAPHAVEMLRSGERFHVVITNKPNEFVQFREEIPMLYLAAAPDPALAASFRCCRAVRKPFHTEQLLAAVKELTESA